MAAPAKLTESSSARAIAAVDALLRDPDRPPEFEPDDAVSAGAAIKRLAARFASADGWVKAVVDGARAGARGLSGDRLQGLAEIIQNADDAGARNMRIALEEKALFVAHDGRPVTLTDVFALATPWITTKSGDASATGRFGIGLMTLQTLSSVLEVYSGHYKLRLGDPTIAVVDDADLPDGLTDAGTLLRIPLEPGVLSITEIDEWFADWDEAALLFCRNVSRIDVTAGGRDLRTLRLRWDDRGEHVVHIGGHRLSVHRRYAHAPDGRHWLVHTADAPPPVGVERANKEVGTTTPLGVALPLQEESGQLYAGLPVTSTVYPVRINAQFDPLTGRQGLANSTWNSALCPMIADLWTAAAVDLFANEPTLAWRVVPLAEPSDGLKQSTVTTLESLLLRAARTRLPEQISFLADGRATPLAEFAVEVARLEGILTDSEIAALAGLDVTLPRGVRDSADHWREVLANWREVGVALPPSVTVEAALSLLDDEALGPEATISLAAAALSENLTNELARLRCVVTEDGRRIPPPTSGDPWLLASGVDGLAGELGLVQRLHPAHFADTDDSRALLEWFKKLRAFGDPSDRVGVLRRLVASGKAGHRFEHPLTDEQLRALRNAFEALNPAERSEFGAGVGRVITIDAYKFDRRGRRVPTTASPGETYLPRAIDKEPDSFAVAAEKTPDLNWAHPRYAETLRSALGRAGLGAQRFLRLLGAEIAPRLIPHPGLERRFESEQRRGLPVQFHDPPGRSQALSAIGASYSLEDWDSPDLAAVLQDIGNDRRAIRRRARAVAILATLGRAWDRLGDFAEVTAALDHYSWQTKGSIRAYWLWRAALIAWLDDNTATPCPPQGLRLRTPSTVAVHGPKADGYIHRDVSVERHEVLAALGITGEPSTGDLVRRLRELRDAPADPETVSADAALIYQGLAARLASRAHITGDLTLSALRQAFASGGGLIRTNVGWQKPTQVFAGKPVFGNRRPFAPHVPGVDRLWTALQIHQPSVSDCIAFLVDLARTGPLETLVDQTAILETLRLLAELLSDTALPPALRRRLAKLPVWTTQGWRTSRPVYAVDDPALTAGLATEVPVWQPGGDLAQFRTLLDPLRLTELAAESTVVVNAGEAELDEEATTLLRAAVALLREDLARNDPATEGAIEVRWDRFSAFEVQVSIDLRVRVHSIPDIEPVVSVSAKADPDTGILYLTNPSLLARVDGGGRAIAGLFTADRRRIAQAWLAACDSAQAGHEAQRLLLAEEQAAEEEAETTAAIAARLAAFRQQTESAHARMKKGRRPARGEKARTDSTGAVPTPPSPTPRVLVDPSQLRVADPRGQLVGGGSGKPTPTRTRTERGGGGKPTKDLPPPKPGGATPQHTASPAGYTAGSKESVGLELVRLVLASDAEEMKDLRAQHGVGADAIDSLERFYELKVYAGTEPDRITLEESQIRRAMSTPDFFLVVVSGVEGQGARPRVRVVVDPLSQLEMTETSSVSFTGVRESRSIVYNLVPE